MIFILLITSCEREALPVEQEDGQVEVVEDKVQIEIFARVNSYHLPSTRGVADESTVGMTPWVFVFKGDGGAATFVEAVQAFEVIGKRYVLLTRQPAGSKYQLLILANAPDKFSYGSADAEYDFVLPKLMEKLEPGQTSLTDVCRDLLTAPLETPLHTVMPYGGAGETIPMTHLLEVDKIDYTTRIEHSDGSSLLLVRSVAKIVIANNASNFELKGVTAVVNVPRQGQLHNLGGAIMSNASNLTEYRFDTANQSTLPVYMYESGTQNDTYFIIQGRYENQDYYYKMAIIDDAFLPMDIRRNCEYTFTINTAKGRGYDTIEDAKESKASNTALDYRVLVDDSHSYEIMANNDYYLGVSNSVFIAYTTHAGELRDYEAFRLTTDCRVDFPDTGTITDNAAEIAPGSFGLGAPARIPIVTGSTTDPLMTPVTVKVSNWLMWYEYGIWGDDGKMRENAYITLKLGNLEKQIHIRQREAVSAVGGILKYIPTGNTNPQVSEVNYFCLTGQVEDGNDNPKDWIKLRSSSTVTGRNMGDRIIVEDGKIYVVVLPNTDSKPRNGIVYLTTIMENGSQGGNSVQRIKIDITQLGQE